jgi:putative alpha-1,2-mannosidase
MIIIRSKKLDMKKLISLMGGEEKFEERLDKTFSKGYLSDYYKLSSSSRSEPNLFLPCLYHYINKQYKSVRVIRDIIKKHFNNNRENLFLGSDGSGVMSSWLIFHLIGIYPVQVLLLLYYYYYYFLKK